MTAVARSGAAPGEPTSRRQPDATLAEPAMPSQPDAMLGEPASAPTQAADELRGVARSGGISLFGAITNAVLGFALVVLVSRGLGAYGAGVFSVAVAVFMTITVTGRLGVDTALVRTLPRLRQLGRSAEIGAVTRAGLVPVCVVMTVVAAAMWWLAPLLAPTLIPGVPVDEAAQLLRVVAATVPLAAGSYVALAATRGLGTIVPITLVENVLKPVGRCVFVALALLLGAGVYGVTVAWSIPTVLGVFLAGWALFRTLRSVRPDTATPARETADEVHPPAWRELWDFAIPRGLAAFFEIAGVHVSIVLVNALAGPADAGVLNAVMRLALAGTLAMQALRLAIAPQISRMLTAGDTASAEHVHQASTVWVVLLSWPLYLVMMIWPGQVLEIFGNEFSGGAVALSVLSVAILVNLAAGNVATILLMSGRSGTTLAVTIASLTLQVVLTVALAPEFGVLGAAIAKGCSVIFETLSVAIVVHRSIGVRTVCRPVTEAALLAFACFALPALPLHLLGLGGSGAREFFTAAVVVALGGLAYLWVIHRLRERFEIAALGAILPSRVRSAISRRFVRRVEQPEAPARH